MCDPLLPQLAAEFGTSTGAAAYTITAFSVAYGAVQILWGPIGDHYGKYRTAAFATLACAIGNFAAVFAHSLSALIICRGIAGATSGGIMPLALAWIGDTVPYAQRQAVLARFLTGTIFGIACGQFIGGLFADTLGWRWAFGALSVCYVLAGVLLQIELRRTAALRGAAMKMAGDTDMPAGAQAIAALAQTRPAFLPRLTAILRDRWARVVLITVGLEGAIIFGALAFVPSELHLRHGVSLTAAGAIVAAYGLGGVGYTLCARHLLARMGERGLAQAGGIVTLLAFGLLWLSPIWQLSVVACFAIGFGFYMLHNTLQTNATQMAPTARGSAVALFASFFFIGQSVGVALAGLVVDAAGPSWLFLIAMALTPAIATGFARALRKRPSHHYG